MNSNTTHLSIVSPVYKGEKMVDELVRQVCHFAEQITPDYEFILVEDGSPDRSWQKIVENCERNLKVKGVKLSRNFGQHNTLSAGLQLAEGQWLIVLDCDLQHQPKYIPELYHKAQEGWEVVFAYAPKQQHSYLRKLQSKWYNRLMKSLTDVKGFDKDVSNYSILSRKVVDAFLEIGDAERQYLMILRWLGFPHTFIEVEHAQRMEGVSTYTFKKLIDLALTGLVFQSSKLLYIPAYLGIGFISIGFLLCLFFSFKFLLFNGIFSGTNALIILLMFCTGLVLFSIGMVGIYLHKIFKQSQNRPLFVIDEMVNI